MSEETDKALAEADELIVAGEKLVSAQEARVAEMRNTGVNVSGAEALWRLTAMRFEWLWRLRTACLLGLGLTAPARQKSRAKVETGHRCSTFRQETR